MTSLVSLSAGDARLDLAPATGGSIVSFTWRGLPVLRPTAAASGAGANVSGHASWPLVPYSNRIAHGELAFGGETYRLAKNFGEHPHPIHGVGWQRPWTVLAAQAATVLLACEHRPADDPAEGQAWPWPFRATQWLALAADEPASRATLRLRLAITNTGDQAFPFGLGWHPMFPRHPRTTLRFAAQNVWETDATRLPTRQVRADGAFDFDAARAPGATALDNVYTGWTGEAELRYPEERRATFVRADTSCSHLVVHVPRNEAHLALEPVTHMTDAFNRAARGEAGTGMRVLAPGESFACTMEIRAQTLA